MRILFILATMIFSLTIFSAQKSLAAGFSTGNEFKSTLIAGHLLLICPGTPDQAPQYMHMNCRASMLEPVEYDYFVGPAVDGDSVVLNVTRGDGSTRSKSSDYDGNKGKSKSRFNLWISTLTQRPLLQDGVNKVEYNITKGNSAVTVGEFTVNVVRQPTAYCRDKTMNAIFPQDCQNQLSACGRYFEEQNYCR